MYQSITFDPGGSTGWSVFQVHDIALVDPGYKILDNIAFWNAGEYVGHENSIIDECVELVEQWPKADVVTEDFILRHFSSGRELLSPVRINAALDYALHLIPRPLNYQPPSLAMTSVTDDRLHDWGFWNNTAGLPHARDAIRHNITWLRRVKENRLKRR